MKTEKTRKSLDQIKKEPSRTFWGKLLAEESRDRKTNEKPNTTEPLKR